MKKDSLELVLVGCLLVLRDVLCDREEFVLVAEGVSEGFEWSPRARKFEQSANAPRACDDDYVRLDFCMA